MIPATRDNSYICTKKGKEGWEEIGTVVQKITTGLNGAERISQVTEEQTE